MCQRFENRKKIDRNIHPIPLLANGPGTGKSRSLQEIPTLLREHAENYTNDDELLNRIKDRMYAINVTFGNSTPENCGALEIVLKDIDTDIDIIIFGIDELNILHNKRGHDNPVREIVHAIGVLNCSGSGTIAHAILNIPVSKDDEADKGGKVSYIDLSSEELKRDNEDLFKGTYNLNEFGFLEHQESEFKLPDESSIKYREPKHQYSHTSQDEHLSPCTIYKNYALKDFYGYTYSSHAEFSEANDKLDVNTASEYELRTVEKII
ncbi:hypothetical protein RhiirC2_785508 [Rhizophagus irregularis]|uniref:Uncharacterized protein n=1 Tax=Rhizophagus irregularis TaxID=588596 RepID=A0A2N1MWC5_9GLOM|nr:hypothetical protein RhiirC2_785508 [Rhizophagus irregularis]